MAAVADSMALVPTANDEPSIELARAAWLHEKRGRSDSAKTERAYADTFDSFRDALHAAGLEVDTPDPRKVALVAQGWAAAPRARDGRPVASATVNQRLAILSSFYTFARRRGLLALGAHPLEDVQRRPVQDYAGARPLEYARVAERLAAIDRRDGNLAGKRDYALLSLGLQTGRRLSELAALRWGDVTLSGGRATVTWRRCKGAKTMRDTLPEPVTAALLAWLHAAYGAELGPTLAPDAPLWISLATNGTRGHPLTLQAISAICARRLGVSQVHALRHTFAHAMETVGAKVSDIQARLGHASLATTGRYLAALRSAENAHSDDLAALFGLTMPPRSAKTTRPLGRRP